jgi:hypothetical protein
MIRAESGLRSNPAPTTTSSSTCTRCSKKRVQFQARTRTRTRSRPSHHTPTTPGHSPHSRIGQFGAARCSLSGASSWSPAAAARTHARTHAHALSLSPASSSFATTTIAIAAIGDHLFPRPTVHCICISNRPLRPPSFRNSVASSFFPHTLEPDITTVLSLTNHRSFQYLFVLPIAPSTARHLFTSLKTPPSAAPQTVQPTAYLPAWATPSSPLSRRARLHSAGHTSVASRRISASRPGGIVVLRLIDCFSSELLQHKIPTISIVRPNILIN